MLSATQSNAAEEMVLSSAGSDVAAQQPSSETGREQGDARKHTQGAAEHDKSHNGALAAPKASLLSSSAVKILFGAAILVATAVALWPSTAPTPLAQTTTAGTQPATQPSANAPSGPTEPASPGGGAPPVTVDVGTGGGAELMADVSAAGARLAPADQTCSTRTAPVSSSTSTSTTWALYEKPANLFVAGFLGSPAMNVLQGSLRQSDILCRWGGEEFIVLLREAEGRPAIDVAEKIRRRTEQLTFSYDDQPLRLTTSIGLSSLQPGDTLHALLTRADRALYEAKRAGRNQTVVDDSGAAVG